MHFSHLLLAALASVASVEAGMIEPGTPDGVYIHQPDPVTGEIINIRVGDLNTTTPDTKLARSASLENIEKRDGVQCEWDLTTRSEDHQRSLVAMANGFGRGLSWSYQMSFVYGSSVSYACDYGNGQTTTSAQLHGFLGDVTRNCGAGTAGWYSIDSWKASYGRTNVGSRFCR